MKITVIIMILNLTLIFDNNNNNINGDLSLYTDRPFAHGHLVMWYHFYENESYMILPSKNSELNNSDLVFQTRIIFLKWVS